MLALKQLWPRYLLAQVLELKLEQVQLELEQELLLVLAQQLAQGSVLQLVQEFVLQA
jgi:hypothetical protein